MPPIVEKVYAYIVQDGELIVFDEPDFPEAPRQVPGGTVEPNEALDDAVLREAYEETGLTGLSIVRYLGHYKEDTLKEGYKALYHFHYYHLQCAHPIPQHWDHIEQFANNSTEPILFRFSRVPLYEVDLIPRFGRFVDILRQTIQTEDQD